MKEPEAPGPPGKTPAEPFSTASPSDGVAGCPAAPYRMRSETTSGSGGFVQTRRTSPSPAAAVKAAGGPGGIVSGTDAALGVAEEGAAPA
jgi:hypothetical protein